MKRMLVLALTLLFIFVVSCSSNTGNNVGDGVPQQPSNAMQRLQKLPPPPQVGIDPDLAEQQTGATAGDIVGQATGSAAPSPCNLFFTLAVDDPTCNSGVGYVGGFHTQSLSNPYSNLFMPMSVGHIAEPWYSFVTIITAPTAPEGWEKISVGRQFLHPGPNFKEGVIPDALDKFYFIEYIKHSSGFWMPYAPFEIVIFPKDRESEAGDRNRIRPTLLNNEMLWASAPVPDLSSDIYLWRYGYIYKESLPNPDPNVVGNWERFEWYWPNNNPTASDYDPQKHLLSLQFDDQLSRENWLPLSLAARGGASGGASTGDVYSSYVKDITGPVLRSNLIAPDGVEYRSTTNPAGLPPVQPVGGSLAVTEDYLRFDFSDAVIGRKIGSVIAFACRCNPGECSDQNLWSCNALNVTGQPILAGVQNGRWMLQEFTAREAQIGVAPPAVN